MFQTPFSCPRQVIASPLGLHPNCESALIATLGVKTCNGVPPPGAKTASFHFGCSTVSLYHATILPSFGDTAGCVVDEVVNWIGVPPSIGTFHRLSWPPGSV